MADVLHDVISGLPTDPGDAADSWNEWAPLLGVVSEGMVRSDGNVVRSDFLFDQLLVAADGVASALSLEALATALVIANLRFGTLSNDSLSRGAAVDTAVYFGNGGDDVFTGGEGQDVYVFGHDIGHATINDIEASVPRFVAMSSPLPQSTTSNAPTGRHCRINAPRLIPLPSGWIVRRRTAPRICAPRCRAIPN